jgi:non-lysosomal glucosylceramidase
MENEFVYRNHYLKEISFPLGGIGSGCIGLGGNGNLIDWEIFNKPNKGGSNGYSHFAVKAESPKRILDARILHGDLLPPYTGSLVQNEPIKLGFGPPVPNSNQFGFGPPKSSLSGMPHFKEVEFNGTFPIATIKFKDESFPGNVIMTAFNPFIPLNGKDSSIPAAFFEIEIENNSIEDILYTICLSIRNPFPATSAINQYSQNKSISFVHLFQNEISQNDLDYGDLTVATNATDVSYQEYWYRGAWFDNLYAYWRDLNTYGSFKNRNYRNNEQKGITYKRTDDHCLLAAHLNVRRGQKDAASFVISWNYPNFSNYWNPKCEEGACKPNKWKNYYATLFRDSKDSATYALEQWARLYGETAEFKNSFFLSSLPKYIIDAISANLSILKTPTVARLEDGSLYGWEGCMPKSGCCEGSCTHVWNYAYALPFLFPDLERSMRNNNLAYNVRSDGHMSYRLQLPIGSPPWKFHACADGQLGEVIKAYRDWKISGNTVWLKEKWNIMKNCIEFAWSRTNEDKWDQDKSGILKGRQHNTLDMELFGPNAWLSGFYLAALKAGTEIAEYFGEKDKSLEYKNIYEKGKSWIEKHLFNGEYYFQDIDIKDKNILSNYLQEDSLVGDTFKTYWDDEHEEIKYQISNGCEVNQVSAQWHANLIGLGEIFDNNRTKKALDSIYKYNFKKNLRDVVNPCRVFGLNDEAGLIICEYPKNRPAIPVTYAEEIFNGFEYMVSSHMIQEGLIEEGLEIVKAVRDRFDGEKRNPWNEFECGSNYSRSMASYALLLALSGFKYDMTQGYVGFSPKISKEKFSCFWCLDKAWGVFEMTPHSLTLIVKYGEIELNRLFSDEFNLKKINSVSVGEQMIGFEQENGCVRFEKPIRVILNKILKIVVS